MPARFVQRWLFITACIAALMTVWRFLPAIEAWFRPQQSAERTVTARGDLAADERSTIELFEKSRDSVVYISSGTGSGFIWDNAGHVVTNLHVIRGASQAKVKLADGRDYLADLVGASPAQWNLIQRLSSS